MRTIRRITLKLNKAKWQALKELAKRYASEKDRHLLVYNSDQQFAQSESERKQRNGKSSMECDSGKSQVARKKGLE